MFNDTFLVVPYRKWPRKLPSFEAGDEWAFLTIRDEQRHYQLDDGCHKSVLPNGVEELLGVLVGYLSGPLHPERGEERTKRCSEGVLIEE